MTPERWSRVKEVLADALECARGDRASLLEQACGGDEELRAEVDSLIAAYEKADSLPLQGWSAAFGGSLEMPASIGPYRLERELGEGGMGQVWLAEQTEPVRRHVALKLIRAGLYDRQATQRFLAERQSLALMNHPAIAKVFDAGATQAGQPFLVMEYVDGPPITEYCDRKALNVIERLRLFQLVCEGVQHAHQKAIIHRDLKPSNILITEVDGNAQPRIIDFGVARGVSRDVAVDARFTQVGTLVGTVGYMSPEQADLDGADIDTRSDVYSLGVILYELLVGTLPFDPKQLSSFESRHRLRDATAPRPSTRLDTGDASTLTAAKNRNTETPHLIRQLHGDLDLIALKALEKDRDRRYATPSALAEDIGNYLRNEPVSAHAPSIGYRTRKYLRRHRVGVGIGVVGAALLVGFVFVQTIQLRNTRIERDRADRVIGFMTNIFKLPNPSEARGNSVTAKEVLDQSSREIEADVTLDPMLRFELMNVMAETYLSLGLYSRAHALAQHVVENQTKAFGADDPKTLESMRQFGSILAAEGRIVDSETLLRQTIERQSRVLGADDLATLQTKHELAFLLDRGAHHAEAEKIERQIIDTESKTLGTNDPKTLRSMNNLASALSGQSRFDEAEPLFRQVLERSRRSLGPRHPETLAAMQAIANMLSEQGRYDEAEVMYREELALQQQVLGPDHPKTASTITTLANTVVRGADRKPEAEALYRKSLGILQRVAGPDNAFTSRAQEGLANVLMSEGNYPEAETMFRAVLESRQRRLGPDDTDVLITQYNLCVLMNHEQRYAESEQLIRQTLQQQMRVLDKDDPDTLASETLLAEILRQQDRPEEAIPIARQAYDTQLRVLGPQHIDTQDSLLELSRSLLLRGRYAEAQALYRQNIEDISKRPKGDPARAWFRYAVVAAAAGRTSDAFEYLNHAIDLGYDAAFKMQHDDDLSILRSDARFAPTLARAIKAGELPKPL
jgi:serine/threonine protein kinase